MAHALRLVLGDQLSDNLSALVDLSDGDLVLMAEVMEEASYVPHHKQKLVMVFSAMRRFAERLRARGVTVRYVALDAPGNSQSLVGEVLGALQNFPCDRIVLTEPGEWRLARAFEALAVQSPVPVEVRRDDRFIASRSTFGAWAKGRRHLRMEYFYREMRRSTGLLMDGDAPVGGRWNFDAENRRRPPRDARAPKRPTLPRSDEVERVIELVEARFPDNFGDLAGFNWPTSHDEAEAVFEQFLSEGLPQFGDWQDAMARREPFLWHAGISAALNIGLLDARDVCRRAEAQYRSGRAPLNAVEGFIRQILGWREFVRGVYWLKGEAYLRTNALCADRALPGFYWTGETDLACIRDVVSTTRAHAYAHHIQRLMVAGNLALLLGVHPDEVNGWYMVVYIDAFEWVEAPNTHGMALFADGGVVGSKPYAASGAYINRMSNYCRGCAYDVGSRRGEKACPFNLLYWDFMLRNRAQLESNPRLAMAYRNLDRLPDAHATIRAEGEALRRKLGAGPLGDDVHRAVASGAPAATR